MSEIVCTQVHNELLGCRHSTLQSHGLFALAKHLLISDIRALWGSAVGAECPNVRNVNCKLDVDGTKHFEM